MLLLALAAFDATAVQGFTPGPYGAQFFVRGTHVECVADGHVGGYVFCTSRVFAHRHALCAGAPVGFELTGTGRSRVTSACGGAAPHVPLRRGERLQAGRIHCIVTLGGIRCQNASGHGFTLTDRRSRRF